MYGKLFASAYTGSMMGAGPCVFAVWAWCIASANVDGMIEINPALLATLIGADESEIVAALEYLMRPDEASRSEAADGRRLVHVHAFTYAIVNYSHYRKMRSAEDRREYMREYMRRKRAGENENGTADGSSATISPRVSTCKHSLSVLANAEAEAEAEAKIIPASPADLPAGAMELAQYLYDAIRSHTPDFCAGWRPARLAKRLHGWAVDLDRLCRLDGADPAEVRRVIDYCHRSADEFERPNVQSGRKLRKRWDSLRVKARQHAGRDRSGLEGRAPGDVFGDTVFFGGAK